MAELLEEWKSAPHADRSIEAVLWKRLSAARNGFTKRRKAYFASLEAERESVRAGKEKLVQEAEALADSTDWSATSASYRELMRQWKEAGRAGRDDEAELWKRFRDAQDKFFAARSEVFAAKETELRAHASVKEQLLAEAQELLPITDWRAARSALRGIQERWEQAGPVPRETRDSLEQGLRRVEEAVRRAEEAQWKRSNPEALARAEGTVSQLRAGHRVARDAARQGPGARGRGRNPQGRGGAGGAALLARGGGAHAGGVLQLTARHVDLSRKRRAHSRPPLSRASGAASGWRPASARGRPVTFREAAAVTSYVE